MGLSADAIAMFRHSAAWKRQRTEEKEKEQKLEELAELEEELAVLESLEALETEAKLADDGRNNEQDDSGPEAEESGTNDRPGTN
jgi:flagellar motility protein MotE (MotC chaperone)